MTLFVVDPDLEAQRTDSPWLFPDVEAWYEVHRDALRYGPYYFQSEAAADYYIQSGAPNPLINSTTLQNDLPITEREKFFDYTWTIVGVDNDDLPTAPPVPVVVPVDGDPGYVVPARTRFPDEFHTYVDVIPQTAGQATQDDVTGVASPDVPEVTAPPPQETNDPGVAAPTV